MRRGGSILAVALLAPIVGATTAIAARVDAGPDSLHKGDGPQLSILTYQASPGEANRLTVRTRPAPGSGVITVLRETGARLESHYGCESQDAQTVTCRSDDDGTIFTGDGDDVVDGDAGLQVLAGPGGDTIRGGNLWGDEGDDDLTLTASGQASGGPGVDDVRGSDGDDVVQGNAAGESGRIDGGPGYDVLDYYSARSAPLTYTLGAGGTDDAVTGVEGVTGTQLDDRLTGDAGGNTLIGAAGHDTLIGGGGPDQLVGGIAYPHGRGFREDAYGQDYDGNSIDGGPGDDVMVGGFEADDMTAGPGNDRVDSGGRENEDGGRDSIVAGPGDDRIITWGGRDRIGCGANVDRVSSPTLAGAGALVASDCERFRLGRRVTIVGRPRRAGRALRVRVEKPPRGRQVLLAYVGKRVVGRTGPLTRTGTYRVRLNPTGRRRLSRGRTVVLSNRAARPALRRRALEGALALRVR